MTATKPKRLAVRFQKALAYAVKLHAKQTRKGTDEPYIGHLLGVASIVFQYGGNENEAIAALLHDAVEDQGGQSTLSAIRRKFGTRVATIVDGCSDSFEIPKPPWLERKKKYLAHIGRAPAAVRFVCAADKLHNSRAILADYRAVGERLWPRFTGGKEGTRWYYREVVKALRDAGSNPLVEELGRVVAEIEKLAVRGKPKPGSSPRWPVMQC
jgi:(p)ppGpp synthase/HD superfamily hydrolase